MAHGLNTRHRRAGRVSVLPARGAGAAGLGLQARSRAFNVATAGT